jgi:hypothetical protein
MGSVLLATLQRKYHNHFVLLYHPLQTSYSTCLHLLSLYT